MTTSTELLRTIQDGAVSNAMPVAELLRRCQVLAARIKLPDLGAWVRYELDGYPSGAELPEYRILPGVAMGHFTGPFGRMLKNGVLPASNLPKDLRDWARVAHLRQPIATIEEVARGTEDDGVRFAWPGDLVKLVQHDFIEYMALAQAWLTVSRSSLVGVVETVRNRILTFALEAEALVATDEGGSSPAPSTALSNVFHTVVYGSVGNLAQGSTNVTQNTGVPAGDLEGLVRELMRLGVETSDIDDLRKAVADDGPLKERRLGTKVAAWVGRMVGKGMSGAWSVATTTATAVLPKLIERYYGLPG